MTSCKVNEKLNVNSPSRFKTDEVEAVGKSSDVRGD